MFDASALLDTLAKDFPTDAGRALQNVFDREEVRAPGLLAWEIGNAVCGPASRLLGDASTEDRARTVVGLMDRVDLEPPSTDAMIAAARLARTHRLTFYDAAYLELASREANAVLVTQDGALARAARAVMGAGRVLDLAGAAKRFA